MLLTLQVKDYALIQNINVEFGNGLNIITGETGAGKSILIDAMGLLLGERASTEVVRKDSSKAVVEGVFSIEGNHKIHGFLVEHDIDDNTELIVRREISLKGSNRCFINDTPVTLAFIKEIGNYLVDLHGQHDHQSLLHIDTHIEMLDEFGNYEKLLSSYKEKITALNKVLRELNDLRKREKQLKEKKEIFEFQLKEINELSPNVNEDEQLENELRILSNAEKLLELTTKIYSELYDSEGSIYDRLTDIKNDLDELAKIDKYFEEKSNDTELAVATINDLAENTRAYKERIDINPDNIEEMRQRFNSLNLLKKKYGGSIENILKYKEKISDEIELADNFKEKINHLYSNAIVVRQEAGEVAKKLSNERIKNAKKIQSEVEKELVYLGISDSKFEVKIHQSIIDNKNLTEDYLLVANKKVNYNSNGIDEIEFYITTNMGEELKPLAKVASGGEISRIMLALKTILAKNDQLPLLIFDEIDTGVSGRIAHKVGKSLKNLSQHHQIISITHLPQIASLADTHHNIVKAKADERVVTSIKKLGMDERIKEIAKLMSGEQLTNESLESARQLIDSQQN